MQDPREILGESAKQKNKNQVVAKIHIRESGERRRESKRMDYSALTGKMS